MEQCLKLERDGIQSRVLTAAIVILLSMFVIIGGNETDYRKMNVDEMEGIVETSEKTVGMVAGGRIRNLPKEKPDEERITLPEAKADIDSITFAETKVDADSIIFPESKTDTGSVTFPETESNREIHTFPETESDRITDTFPEIEPGMTEMPEEGNRVTDMPSDETGEWAAADADNREENDVPDKTPFLIDEAGMICGFSPEYADVEDGIVSLPAEGCVGIRSGAFLESGSDILELYIPANITMIEEGALSGMSRLEWIEADEGNEAYTSVEGVLFDSTMTSLLAFPAGRTGTYKIPASVTYITYGAFDNTTLLEIDMRDCCPDIDYSVLSISPANLILPREQDMPAVQL